MATLHSTMRNSRGNIISTTNNDYVETMVETHHLRIVTTMWKDGSYYIFVIDRETDIELRRITDHDEDENQVDKRYRVHNPEEREDTEEEKRAWDERDAETAANYYEQGPVLYE